jgi:hypothetical protein
MHAVKGESRLTLVWMILVALSLLALGSRDWFLQGRLPAFAIIIVLTLIKVRLVLLEFMELRGAPWALRMAFEAWLLGLGSILLYEFD